MPADHVFREREIGCSSTLSTLASLNAPIVPPRVPIDRGNGENRGLERERANKWGSPYADLSNSRSLEENRFEANRDRLKSELQNYPKQFEEIRRGSKGSVVDGSFLAQFNLSSACFFARRERDRYDNRDFRRFSISAQFLELAPSPRTNGIG